MQGKKITLATVKKFIRENIDKLLVRYDSQFDGMDDCVHSNKDPQFQKAEPGPQDSYHQGVKHVWFVGQSRDWFSKFENENHIGIAVSNSCGSFVLAVPKN